MKSKICVSLCTIGILLMAMACAPQATSPMGQDGPLAFNFGMAKADFSGAAITEMGDIQFDASPVSAIFTGPMQAFGWYFQAAAGDTVSVDTGPGTSPELITTVSLYGPGDAWMLEYFEHRHVATHVALPETGEPKQAQLENIQLQASGSYLIVVSTRGNIGTGVVGVSLMCASGECGNAGGCDDATDCDDGNYCTLDTCDMDNCLYAQEPDGSWCEENGLQGICIGGMCRTDYCMEVHCFENPDPCQTTVANYATCTCYDIQVEDGTPCGADGEVCMAGACIVSDICQGIDCDDGNPCTNNWCDPTMGYCQMDILTDGQPCMIPQGQGVCQGGGCVVH